MAETEHEEPRRDGYFFDIATFRLDLYRLLAVFFASADFARLRGCLDTERMAGLRDTFEEYEVMRLFVSIASTVRIVQDREVKYFERVKTNCGRLTPNTNKPRQSKALSLREACNKIVHANKFNFDTREIRVRDGDYVGTEISLRPFIYLYGTQRAVPWKASVDVVAFAACNTALIQG